MLAEGPDGYPPWPGGTVSFLEGSAYARTLAVGMTKWGSTTLVAKASLVGLVVFSDVCVARDIDATRAATEYGLVLEPLNEAIGSGATYMVH